MSNSLDWSSSLMILILDTDNLNIPSNLKAHLNMQVKQPLHFSASAMIIFGIAEYTSTNQGENQ